MFPSPQVSPTRIGLCWTDDQIIMNLVKFMKGSPLPENVIADINPYQFKPSYLPDGIWYFVRSTENKDTELGSWKIRGESCQIYEDCNIRGWKTTLEFYEGPALAAKRTDWVMQEFKITNNRPGDKNKPEDCQILCRVFVCTGKGPSSSSARIKIKDADTVDEKFLHSTPNIPSSETIPAQDSNDAMQLKNHTELLLTGEHPDPASEALLELDFLLSGDYLELDDLADQESGFSSSDNSSCVSITSDECFDSLALLRDLEDELNKDLQEKAPNLKFSVAASARPSEMIVQPTTLGSLATATGSGSSTEKPALKRQKEEHKNEGASSSHDDASSSSSDKAGEKLPRSKKKAKKKFLCFMPF